MYDVSRLKIWKYWENTKGTSTPKYIDMAMYQPQEYSSHELVVLNEVSVLDYLPNLNAELENTPITQIAHKADFIRASLLVKYGGLYLDSDSIIVKNLDCLFKDLEYNSVVSFTESGILNNANSSDPALIQCMGGRPGAFILQDWHELQRARLRKKHALKWTEIGASAFNTACLKYPQEVKIRPAITIEPIKWNEAAEIFRRPGKIEDYLTPEILCFMWFNKVNKLENLNKDSLFIKLIERYL